MSTIALLFATILIFVFEISLKCEKQFGTTTLTKVFWNLKKYIYHEKIGFLYWVC
jgi:hypothetical protein